MTTLTYSVVRGDITPTEALRALIVEYHRKGRNIDALLQTLEKYLVDPEFDFGYKFIRKRNEPPYWIRFNS